MSTQLSSWSDDNENILPTSVGMGQGSYTRGGQNFGSNAFIMSKLIFHTNMNPIHILFHEEHFNIIFSFKPTSPVFRTVNLSMIL
jgi:hypothetical protein